MRDVRAYYAHMTERTRDVRRLRKARARAGLTQPQAAAALGLCLRAYQKMESESETPPVRRAFLVALEAEPAA